MADAVLTAQERSDAVRRAALDVGFDAVGIAAAIPLGPDFDRYREWIDRGYHGTMSWMERNMEARNDVTTLVPGARSVIVVARTYDTAPRHPQGAVGKLSRYAWGDDYHDVMPAMLDALIERMRAIEADVVTRRYVDTGPMLEKQWAVRAGLGWQGKHTNILRRDLGSFFFLGAVITTMDCVPDQAVTDHCGSCTACIDACPTAAIIEPNLVDARKCISYWTIETKPEIEIPPGIAEGLDGWIFGCDTCQDVCPWNRFRRETTDVRFQPRHGETVLNVDDVVTLQPEQFRERFRRSPVKRTKLGGLQRNARALQTKERRNDGTSS